MNKLILQVERRANRSTSQRITEGECRLARTLYRVIPRDGADTARMLAYGLQMLREEHRAKDDAIIKAAFHDLAGGDQKVLR